MANDQIKERLEYLRGEIKAERIFCRQSYGRLQQSWGLSGTLDSLGGLQSAVEYIVRSVS